MVRAAPDDLTANLMRAEVLCGSCDAWEVGSRSAAELLEAATHFERAVPLCPSPTGKAQIADRAVFCRAQAMLS